MFYRRPEGSGSKLDSRWLGPAVVLAREGEWSYLIQVKENATMKAHRSFLKIALNDNFFGQAVPQSFHQRTVLDHEAQGDEWLVESILDHKVGSDGRYRFLTKWPGHGHESNTLEPASSFV